ncbi:GIY-YIG nuclease family protein [Fructilactobacillus carniphilus]|uniref:GIY-YIG nuclease family protein n=1 Tax=Fructilactobacillus carniphilus TaxID=2940297 RepID=A0ABY5C102_9LACO|nr:GIY-YIG nuclease family protein [Fructilactobacillus carniphilus]USS90991.1 GIY-YIG nuclease family protein [Fructilactobacillus carniphilus]
MEANKLFYFYVLLCDDGSFYGGFTTDVSKRFQTHRSGKGAKYTKVHRPVSVLYSEAFTEKRAALQAEYRFKHQSRQQKERFLQTQGLKPRQWRLSSN